MGGTINFKIESPATSYKIDIYRMGYYGGDGARLITSVTPNITVSQNQPACNTNTATGLVDCCNWGVSASWTVPTTPVSGVYFAHIYRTDGTTDENQIPFVVRDDASHSTSSSRPLTRPGRPTTTGAATASTPGMPRQTGQQRLDPGRAVQVSYDRPFATRFDTPYGQDYFFYAEFPTIEFLEENGYDVSYTDQANVAASQGASLIEQHKVFMKAGHDEYWSASEDGQRDRGQERRGQHGVLHRQRGVLEDPVGGEPRREADRTLITYKESLDSAQTDPSDPPTWTGAWRDPRFSPPADGGQPQNALTGQLWTVNAGTSPSRCPRVREAAILAKYRRGQPAVGPDRDADGRDARLRVGPGRRQRVPPAGRDRHVVDHENAPQVMTDYQEDSAQPDATQHPHPVPGGQRRAGLRRRHRPVGVGPELQPRRRLPARQSPIMQQATVNLLADMGAPADDADVGPGRGDRVHRHHPAHLDHHLASAGAASRTAAP